MNFQNSLKPIQFLFNKLKNNKTYIIPTKKDFVTLLLFMTFGLHNKK